MSKRIGQTVRLDEATWEQLKRLAILQRRACHDILLDALQSYLAANADIDEFDLESDAAAALVGREKSTLRRWAQHDPMLARRCGGRWRYSSRRLVAIREGKIAPAGAHWDLPVAHVGGGAGLTVNP